MGILVCFFFVGNKLLECVLLTKWLDERVGASDLHGGGDRAWEEKPGGKRPFGRQRHSWENNIKIDVKEIIWV